MIPLHPAIFEAGNTGWIQMMEIDQLAVLPTTLDFHLLLTQSNPPARKSLPPSTLDCTLIHTLAGEQA
jgi:hypothetical protein